MDEKQLIKKHCRGFVPIVLDLETSGSDPDKHGILEIAAVCPSMKEGHLSLDHIFHRHVALNDGVDIDPEASRVHNIPIDHPFRFAISLKEMLEDFRTYIERNCERYHSRRGIIVGHNPSFDMAFLNRACAAYGIELPVHSYTFIDTASMGLLRHRETVLARLCQKERLGFMHDQAHSALYDAYMTARLFWSFLGYETPRELPSMDVADCA